MYLNFPILANTSNKRLVFELAVRVLSLLKKSIHMEIITYDIKTQRSFTSSYFHLAPSECY